MTHLTMARRILAETGAGLLPLSWESTKYGKGNDDERSNRQVLYGLLVGWPDYEIHQQKISDGTVGSQKGRSDAFPSELQKGESSANACNEVWPTRLS